MAKFDMEQTMAVVAVQQLLGEWATDLDLTSGKNIGNFITDDVSYNVGPSPREGRAEVEAFYQARRDGLAAKGADPVMRHIITNFRVSFDDADNVSADFELIFWTTEIPGLNPADVVAVADVWMKCRRDGTGDWRISKFDSTQPLKRLG